MTRTLKTFLLWLLIAVLPLNAVAGSLGMSCSPVHQQLQEPTVTGVLHQKDMTDAHAQHGTEHAGHAVDSTAAAASLAPDVEKQPHTSCGACSAFCLGAAAPPSTDLAVPSFNGSDVVLPSPAAFAVGFIQDGPQRPPRHQSA
ncbi:hypothetical protein IM543_15355 [Massilia sp. UMI-21]|nr:hypothetical protein IM543_15355 [Massilia sp. UMI-21]